MIKLVIQPFSRYHAIKHWYYSGTLFLIVALIVAFVRSYRKAYMNYLDTLLFSDLALIYYAFSCGADMLHMLRILLEIPMLAFLIVMIIKIIHNAVRQLSKCTCTNIAICKLISLRTATSTYGEQQQGMITHDNLTAGQPLIEPTSTVVSYDTCTNN